MSFTKRNDSDFTGRWGAASRLFEAAVELAPEARAAFLREHTRADAELLAEVESLLAAHGEAARFLESPVGLKLAEALETKPEIPRLAYGERIGDYRIERLLGCGGFASVYLAKEQSLNRDVALKVSRNFGHEARTMAPLEHDHIVKVFSQFVDADRDQRLICMQFIPGTSVAQLNFDLRKQKLEMPSGAVLLEIVAAHSAVQVPLNTHALKERERLASYDFIEAVLWLGTRIADALAHAHARGVLHLDVKPGNLLVNMYGRPLLTDFNVAFDRHAAESGTAALGGTEGYMAPEHQAALESPEPVKAMETIDARADIFSLGLVLREMLESGGVKLPLPGATSPPSVDRTEEELGVILSHCCARDAAKRFPTASYLEGVLTGALELRGLRKALPEPGRLVRFAQRSPVMALALVCLLFPQLIGSLVNIGYNASQIVNQLDAAQNEAFRKLLVAYNLIVYPVGLAFFIYKVSQLARSLRFPASHFKAPGRQRRDRRRVLQLPLQLVLVTAWGWLPGSILFPLGIHWLAGPVAPGVFMHFFISFLLSFLVATSHSVLYTQLVCLRVLYPLFFQECSEIRKTAARELAPYLRRIRVFQWLPSFIPLTGAALLIFIGPERIDPGHYQLFRVLVTCLLGIGMLGMRLSHGSLQVISQTVSALTGNARQLPGAEAGRRRDVGRP